MDEYRKRLEENADEAEFALMIDDYLNDLGESLQNEYEDAKRRGEAPEMPEDMKKRLRQFIANYNEPVETTSDSACNAWGGNPDNNLIVRRPSKWVRRLGIVAATIAIVVGSLFTVQAAGINIFGTIAHWTDSIFEYNKPEKITHTDSSIASTVEQIKHSLLSQGISQNNSPSWIPERFEIKELKSNGSDGSYIIHAILLSPQSETLIIDISGSTEGEEVFIEKTAEEVEIVNVLEKTFYVFENNNNVSGVWSDGNTSISIYGNISKEELKLIISSIGGNLQ